MNNLSVDILTPFPLAYIEWCQGNKEVTHLSETERRDWVMEFGHLYSTAGGSVDGLDIARALGRPA